MKKLMNKLVPAVTSLLLTAPAWAVEAPADIPVETVNPIWVLVFLVGCVVGVVWYVIATNKASKAAAQQK